MKTVWKDIQGKVSVLNVGRNQKCPCGSGEKFKKCCIDRAGRPPLVCRGKKGK